MDGDLVAAAELDEKPRAEGDIVVVRLMYQWPVYVSMMGLGNMSDLSGNKKLIMATAAFRNEPYQ